MAFAAARVAGTSTFLVAVFDGPGTDARLVDECDLGPILDGESDRLRSLIEAEKSRAALSAAAA